MCIAGFLIKQEIQEFRVEGDGRCTPQIFVFLFFEHLVLANQFVFERLVLSFQ